jgi:hypothetical protein
MGLPYVFTDDIAAIAGQFNADFNYLLPQQIQDYTVVGAVGSVGQQYAGRDYTLAELEAYFTAAKVISFYKFGAGAALPTDEKAAFSYTLGAAAKAPSNGVGIMGLANTAISFDGGDYATHATKFGDMTTTYSGAGKGLIHSFWVSAPTDGQPAIVSYLFYKLNTASNDRYAVILNTDGTINVVTRANSATQKQLFSTTILPNGANTTILHCVVVWNTVVGLQLFINGKLEAHDNSATTLMLDGNNTGFFVGATDATPSNTFTGLLMNEIVIKEVATQAMIDFLYATTIPLPVALQAQDFMLMGTYKNLGVATDIRQFTPEITQIRTTDILLKPDVAWQATDSRRLVGRI